MDSGKFDRLSIKGRDSIVAEATEVLRTLETLIELPSECGVLLVGSLADGLGNPLSDFDLLIIDPQERSYTSGRQFIPASSRRCEVSFHTVSQLLRFAKAVNRFAQDTQSLEIGETSTRALETGLVQHTASRQKREPTRFDEEAVQLAAQLALTCTNLYQRIYYGLPLAGHDVVKTVKRAFHGDVVTELVCRETLDNVRADMENAALALAVNSDDACGRYCRSALGNAAAHHMAKREDSYSSKKFLIAKLQRNTIEPATRSAIETRLRIENFAGSAAENIQASRTLIADLTPITQRDWSFEVGPRLSLHTFELWDEIFIAAGAAIFWLRPDLAAEARERRGSYNALLNVPGSPATPLIEQLLRFGLLQATEVTSRRVYTLDFPAPQHDGIATIKWNGVKLAFAGPVPPMLKLAFPSMTLASIGISVVTVLSMVDVHREDAVGAIRVRRWDQVEHAYRSVASAACSLAILSVGVYPAPSEQWLLEVLASLPQFAHVLRQARRVLSRQITNAGEALAAHSDLAELLSSIAPLRAEKVPGDQTFAATEEVLLAANTWANLASWLSRRGAGEALDEPYLEMFQAEGKTLCVDPSLLRTGAYETMVAWRNPVDILTELTAINDS